VSDGLAPSYSVGHTFRTYGELNRIFGLEKRARHRVGKYRVCECRRLIKEENEVMCKYCRRLETKRGG
jgi:hypothetical protein